MTGPSRRERRARDRAIRRQARRQRRATIRAAREHETRVRKSAWERLAGRPDSDTATQKGDQWRK